MNDPTLLADLGAALVGDRGLGDRVLLALCKVTYYHSPEKFWSITLPVKPGEYHSKTYSEKQESRPNPTLSVDDGLALVREEYNLHIDRSDMNKTAIVSLWITDNADSTVQGITGTIPLALSIALIKAYLS